MSEGEKTLLYMRADFPDIPGEPVTEAQIRDVFKNINEYFRDNSQGKLSIKVTVSPVLRVPHPSTWYIERGWLTPLHVDLVAVAKSEGYDPANYDLEIALARRRDGDTGGVAAIYGKGLALTNDAGLGLTVHELSHNIGLPHATLWNTVDGSIAGDGARGEYQIPFDPSGHSQLNSNLAQYHINTRFKQLLGWIPDDAIQTVTKSGVYRLYAHDIAGADGVRGLKVAIDDKRNYWIEFRQAVLDKPWLMNGVEVYRTYNAPDLNTELLDMTPDSLDGAWDSPLLIGRTYSDSTAKIHITPLAITLTPRPAIDVEIKIGSFEANKSPQVKLRANVERAGIGERIRLTALATDRDGDPLYAHWDFGDRTFEGGCLNTTKQWASAGDYVVRCIVTDKKGGTASDSIVVSVVSSTGPVRAYRINGQVTYRGQPVADAAVRSSPQNVVWTNSGGYYTLANVPSGRVIVDVRKAGLDFIPANFSNPMSVYGSLRNIDFIALPTTYQSVSQKASYTSQDILCENTNLPPGLCSWGEGRLDLFVRGRDRALWHRAYENEQWGTWESLGGVLTSAPVAVSWQKGRIDILARSGSYRIIHKWFANGNWSGWESEPLDGLHGLADSAPTICSWAPGRLDVFARGTDNALWHKAFENGWSAWESLGGQLCSEPSAVCWGAGRIDIVALHENGEVAYKWFETEWHDWDSAPVDTVSVDTVPVDALKMPPTISSWGAQRLDIFVPGQDGRIRHRPYEGKWLDWEKADQKINSAPVAVSINKGEIALFAIEDRTVIWKRFKASWGNWEPLP